MYQLLAFRQAGSITSNLSDESNGGMGCAVGCTVLAFNPLPSGTLAAFFLTAVGPIQHTKEGDISREKTILMT